MNLKLYLLQIQESLLYENKWKALVKMGRLTEPAVQKIMNLTHNADPLYVKQLLKLGKGKQAAEYLAKKGIVKSPAEWAAGIEKGTENIIKQYGFKVQDAPHHTFAKKLGLKPGEKLKDFWMSHSAVNAHSGKSVIHVPKEVPHDKKLLGAIIKRHEADELRVSRQAEKAVGKGSNKFLKGISTKGNHMSDEVLRREKELLYFARQIYPEQSKDLVQVRLKGAEYMPFQFKNAKQVSKESLEKFKKMKKEYEDYLKLVKSRPVEERKEAFVQSMKSVKASGASKKDIIRASKRYLSIYKLKLKTPIITLLKKG